MTGFKHIAEDPKTWTWDTVADVSEGEPEKLTLGIRFGSVDSECNCTVAREALCGLTLTLHRRCPFQGSVHQGARGERSSLQKCYLRTEFISVSSLR